MTSARLSTRAAMAVPIAAALALAACAGSEGTTTVDSVVVDASSDATELDSTEVESVESVESVPADDADPGDDMASGFLGSYELADEEFGTMTTVTVDGDTRTIVSNALPDHETGEFPNSGNPNTISEQDASYSYTTDPTWMPATAPRSTASTRTS